MNVKFAPGSWIVQGVEVVANHAGESFRVATVHGDHEPNWNGRMHIAALQANAHLIAAAPSMYVALVNLLEQIREDVPAMSVSKHFLDAMIDAENAVKAAQQEAA